MNTLNSHIIKGDHITKNLLSFVYHFNIKIETNTIVNREEEI